MHRGEFVYADGRWENAGWNEAFRLRVFGWVPEDWARRGVKAGVFKRPDLQSDRTLFLTAEGRRLTDIDPSWFSMLTARGLSSVMAVRDFQPSWVQEPKGQTVFRAVEVERFPAEYAALFLFELEQGLKRDAERQA